MKEQQFSKLWKTFRRNVTMKRDVWPLEAVGVVVICVRAEVRALLYHAG